MISEHLHYEKVYVMTVILLDTLQAHYLFNRSIDYSFNVIAIKRNYNFHFHIFIEYLFS